MTKESGKETVKKSGERKQQKSTTPATNYKYHASKKGEDKLNIAFNILFRAVVNNDVEKID